MKVWSRVGIAVSLSLMASSSWAQSAPLQAKQLAGPAEEISSIQAADPSEGMLFSRSALLPIQFDQAGNWHGSLPAEKGRLRFVLMTRQSASAAALTSPRGQVMAASALAGNAQQVPLGADMPGVMGTRYQLDGVAAGSWQMRLQGQPGERGFVLLEGDPAVELGSYPAHRDRRLGQSFVVRSVLEDANAATARTRLGVAMEHASMRVTDETGVETDYRCTTTVAMMTALPATAYTRARSGQPRQASTASRSPPTVATRRASLSCALPRI